MPTDVHLKLDPVLVTQAGALGSLEAVVNAALRRALDRDEQRRLRAWAEENAILIEALGDSPAEAAGFRA
jgi:hypothetical protein